MPSPPDRLRRVLSDGLLESSSPPCRAPSDAEGAVRPDLRARLRALGLEAPQAPEAASGPPPTGSDRPLVEAVRGSLRETPHGACIYVERRHPLARRHGRVRLADALRHEVPLRPHERVRGGPRRLRAGEALFFDTETTGLAGGTGTVAFLIGAGRIEDDTLVVRQYGMRDFPDEPALLHAFLEDLGDAPLVSFNGRSFDWPLLVTRLRLHHMDVPHRAHLDLLPAARRLWSERLPSRSLGSLEEHVLGLRREDDLPGWRIPDAYFEFLRTGRSDLVARAFDHNEIDVVSMLGLLTCVGGVLAAPERPRDPTPRDPLGTARLLLDLGEAAGARRCLEAGLREAQGEASVALRQELGHLARRQRRYEDAIAHWIEAARASPPADVRAHVEVAKLLEHRQHAFDEALAWVERALGRVPTGSAEAEALHHRARRLRRRRDRAAGAGT